MCIDPPVPGLNILITGVPGCGKTTLIMELARRLAPYRPAGFFTREFREKGERFGFELVSLGGQTGILADARMRSGCRVGKYGVDIPAFESFLGEILFFGAPLVIIDEIGKMECFSPLFRTLIPDLLDSPSVVLATIALRGTPFIESFKSRRDVEICLLDRQNRVHIADLVEVRVREVLEKYDCPV
ncbi:MAG: nucleoside-triphosphatase [Methanolinea sp.]|jgi:nucleoside-triphosphatase|nr:nucleoside-triphosphatase [Methanolinea sp.]